MAGREGEDTYSVFHLRYVYRALVATIGNHYIPKVHRYISMYLTA